MTTWDEQAWTGYATAVRGLDQLRRDAIAAVASQQAAAEHVRDRINQARDRAASQRSEFAQVAARLAVPTPGLEPDASRAGDETTDAGALTRMDAALQEASEHLDEADATLAGLAQRPSRTGLLGRWPTPLRNALVYFWYAALALIAIVEIDHVGGPSARAGTVVLAFAIGLPAVAWAVGWLSVGVLFSGDRGDGRRSLWLGVTINVVSLVAGLLLARR
jgi:hypothetical protein